MESKNLLNKVSSGLRQAGAFAVLSTMSAWCMAAADHSGDFQQLYQQLLDWTGGTLGKSIALIFLLIGLGVGTLRGSILGAVACLAAAISLVIAPDVINSIFTTGAGA